MNPYFVMIMGLIGLCLSVWFGQTAVNDDDERAWVMGLGAAWAAACLYYVLQ